MQQTTLEFAREIQIKVRSYAIYMLNIFFFDDFQSLPPSENSLQMFRRTPRTSSNKKNIKTKGYPKLEKYRYFIHTSNKERLFFVLKINLRM